MKKYIISTIIAFLAIGSVVYGATILTVPQGGTGATTLTGCLEGNGTGAITGTGVACGSGGGSDPFTHPATGQSATTSLMLFNGNASTTKLSASTAFFNYFISTSTTATSTINNALKISTSTATSFYSGCKLCIENYSTTLGSSYGMLGIYSLDASGGNYDIRIDSPNIDLEFVETDQVSPAGKFEIGVNNNKLNFNLRAGDDSQFVPGMSLSPLTGRNGVMVGIGTEFNNPGAMLEVVATSSKDAFHLTSDSSHHSGNDNGDLFFVGNTGLTGVGSTSPWGLFSVNANGLSSGVPQFVVGSSTGTNFIVTNGGRTGIATSSPSQNALFSVGTTTFTAFHWNGVTSKVGIGCENSGPSRLSFGCGTNTDVNPNVIGLFQDPSDARFGAAVNSSGIFMKSSGGIYGYNYTGAAAININLQEFGGNVGIASSVPTSLLSVGSSNTGTFSISTSTDGCPQFTKGLMWIGTCASGSGGSFPFSADTNYGVQVYSTSTPTLWFKSGLYASSTSYMSVVNGTSLTGTSTFANAIKISTSTNTSYYSGCKLCIENYATTLGSSYGMLGIYSLDSSGGNYDIRIDSPNPDIELIETDQTSPAGKFEVAVNGDKLQFNLRNGNDDSFQNVVALSPLTGRWGAMLGIGTVDNNPGAMLAVVATSTKDAINVTSYSSHSTGSEVGDLFYISNGGTMAVGSSSPWLGKATIVQTGNNPILNLSQSNSATTNYINLESSAASAGNNPCINWSNVAGVINHGAICSTNGSSYTNSNMTFSVANSSKSLTERARIDVNGGLLIATTTPWLLSKLNVVGTTTIAGNFSNLRASTSAATTQTIDWSAAQSNGVASTFWDIMLTGNTTIVMNATSSNPIDGGTYKIRLCQDPTGSRTVTWATPGQIRWTNGTTTVTSTANRCTLIGFIYTSVNGNSIYSAVASSTNIDIK